ncbi:MAG TPA: SDR family oxidoreductase [Myxococcota bacterium]|jgi:NAD(P)-dependent dehydrogenase (short-subunit alcohol dehydrogenase family)|nr:SDR family oxidoreductase [Myxococcota bacterium]
MAGAAGWTVRDRVCVVTGATSGIGEEIALGLARAGGRVVVVGRSKDRAEATLARIRRDAPGAAPELALANLAVQAEVRRLAQELLGRFGALHVLVNNAGVMNTRRETTPDGLEATFAVNHLAYFLLTTLLLDRLRASAPARIVNVASDAHRFGRLDLDDLQSERSYRSMQVYGRSKGANLLFTQELARRLAGSGVTVNAIHPGAVATGLGHQNGAVVRLLARLLSPFFRTPAQGADTAVWLATAPELEGVSGRYFAKRRELEPAPHARDPELARRLFDASERLTAASAA